MKKTHDYDSAFKTLKNRHKRLFIAVINEAFHKSYPTDSEIRILPSEGFFHDREKAEDEVIEERINDFLLCVGGDYYLLECQTYDDDSIVLRLAEYTFLAARSVADYGRERIVLPMPYFTVLYIKPTGETPRTTTITYRFPDGETFDYKSENIFLNELTKEAIIEKKLYALIPFYIARYEKELVTEKDYEKAIKDLEYFRDKMIELRKKEELNDYEIDDLRDCVNQIVMHITDGNEIEKEVVSVMGGEIFEMHSEKIIREATEPLIQKLADKDKEILDKDRQISDKDKQISDRDKQISEAESRADEAESRADEAKSRADEAENRASMLEQELEKQRKKLQMLEEKLREADGK